MNKFMTWTSGTYFECNKLLQGWQISRLIDSLSKTKQDVFVTIQDYDSEGDIIGCPLFFDIDSPSLMDAYNEAVSLYEMIIDEYQIEPLVWFSGGKGFHVVAPLYVRHPRCHEIVQMIWKDLFKQVECDEKVYRTRSMFRCENTWNVKGERYKIPLNDFPDCDLADIIEKAKARVEPQWHKHWTDSIVDLDVSKYVDQLPEFKPAEFEGNVSFKNDMMPCLRNLWAEPTPPEGQRHELALLMVRHCYRAGLEREQAAAVFAEHPFWSKVKENDYLKIIRTIYNNGRAMMGCKNNKMLQDNCIKFCKYNTGMTFADTLRRD